jgi:uncharacterized protein (DUF952 family)
MVLKKSKFVRKKDLLGVVIDTEKMKGKSEFEKSANGATVGDVAKLALKPCIYKRR